MKKETQISIFYSLFVLILLFKFIQQITMVYPKDYWPLTDWLVNYQGGFVRRGLAGEFLLRLYNYFGLNTYSMILFLSIIIYLAVIIFFSKSFLKNGYSIFILPFVFFLGDPILNDFWIGTDNLIILIFILIIYLAIRKSNFKFLHINLLLIIGLLVHETIAFICFPILLLILINEYNYTVKLNKGHFSIKFIAFPIIKIFPSILIFFSCIYYHGSESIANAIWNSWKSIIFPRHVLDSNQFPGVIRSLPWSLSRGLSITYINLKDFSDGVYGPIAWILILVLVYYLLININDLNFKILKYHPTKQFNKANISNILILQFISITPLFILGWDYGRWIFYWVCSSFAIILLIPDEKLNNLTPKFIKIISTKINNFLDSLLGKYHDLTLFITLIIGFPRFSWSLWASLESSPLILFLRYISFIIQKLLPFQSIKL